MRGRYTNRCGRTHCVQNFSKNSHAMRRAALWTRLVRAVFCRFEGSGESIIEMPCHGLDTMGSGHLVRELFCDTHRSIRVLDNPSRRSRIFEFESSPD
jgi:hypothetical protein